MSRLPFTLTALMSPEPQLKNTPQVLTVQELVESVKRDIETKYRVVQVIGELSSFKAWRSGHWYFDLKDQFALLPCVMFRNLTSSVPFEMKDGLQIVVTARATVYAQQSKIQLVVERIEPCGVGALALAFEQLKAKLESEGLFAKERKKALIPFPRTVGLVTSPQGAALQDMLRVLRQRMPAVKVLLAPCRVQGEGSAQEIASALRRLDASGECDVIILGRGGGSLEDLWAFNDEQLARTIVACQTPIVSAVGHETDFSISDFVSDLRAATPTHAAASVVPDVREVLAGLSNQEARLQSAMRGRFRGAALRLEKSARRLSDPRMLLLRAAQRVDELLAKARNLLRAKRLRRLEQTQVLRRRLELASPMSRVGVLARRLKNASQRFWLLQPRARCTLARHRTAELQRRALEAMKTRVKKGRERLNQNAAALSALSPLAVMGRGYAIVYQDNALVSSVEQVTLGQSLRIRLSDGSVDATVINCEKDQ